MAPCIGTGVEFDFSNADVLYSNLGGMGPDCDCADGIRYVNVVAYSSSTGVQYLDLVVTNASAYSPCDTSQTTMSDGFFVDLDTPEAYLAETGSPVLASAG